MNKLLRLWPLAMIPVLVVMFVASYVGAYFVMQRSVTQFGRRPNGVFVVRRYSADWQVVLFQPAAKVETMICNHPVQLEFTP